MADARNYIYMMDFRSNQARNVFLCKYKGNMLIEVFTEVKIFRLRFFA